MWQMEFDKCNATNAMSQMQCDKFNVTYAMWQMQPIQNKVFEIWLSKRSYLLAFSFLLVWTGAFSNEFSGGPDGALTSTR